jgi:pimeloyl-ACP methyl ester carboxylesterase
VETDGPSTGDPLLVLHGWGSNAQLMRPIASAFSDSHRVCNVDLPGHGHSPPPPEPSWGVPEHAALVAELIEAQLGGGPVTIIGHSNGGRIALYMASDPEYAGLIDRLVLISPSGITPTRPWSTRLKSGLAKTLKAPFEPLPDALRDPAMDWLRHSLVWRALGSSDYNALQGVMRATFVKTVNHHVDDRVHRIDVPTLLFWGDEDTAVSRQQMETLEQSIPDAGLVVLGGAGHYGHLDDPTTVITATCHFLDNT